MINKSGNLGRHPNHTHSSTNMLGSKYTVFSFFFITRNAFHSSICTRCLCWRWLGLKRTRVLNLILIPFSIAIALIECTELSFQLFFCLLEYHIQLSAWPNEQWINQVLMKMKTWKLSTAMFKLCTHLTTFSHDQF
jgi:hypothetical protein